MLDAGAFIKSTPGSDEQGLYRVNEIVWASQPSGNDSFRHQNLIHLVQ